MRLKNKVAVITGSSKGIGKGCARVFAREGAAVVIVSRTAETGRAMAQEIQDKGGRAIYVQTDVSRSEQVQNMINHTIEAFGRLDILINNAGYHISKNIEETSEEEWDFIINTNLKSVFLCSKYALPHLRKTQGCIINISSMVGLVGQSKAGAYSATKGGIIAMTKGMALDFAEDGIRINCICPGWIRTPLVDDWFSQQPDEQKARDYINSVHPLGRIGTSEECGRIALFLATEDASFMTGSIVTVDGGVTLGY
jgi:NAD(P)-dependent dehydrogenase (short-subunit alcohol dehydrogenase family)